MMQNAGTNDGTTGHEEEELVREVERYSWWCGGGVKPLTGKDLGVFESSLEDRANLLSLLSLSYLNPLLSLGSRKVLDAGDIGVPSKQDRAAHAYGKTKAAWDEQVKICEAYNRKQMDAHQRTLETLKTEESKLKVKPPTLKEPSVAKALFRSFGIGRFFIALSCYIVASLLSFVPVLILNDLVAYFEHVGANGTGIPYNHFINPWVEVAALGVVPLIVSVLQTRHQAIMAHCGVFVRTAVSTLLYRKSLTVSAAGRAKTSTGQVVNMMSNDTMQLQRFLQFVGLTISAPIQIVIALYLISQEVGKATWVGFGYMVLLAPVNMVIFAIVGKLQKKVLKYSDLRVKMMNEILTGVRIIKFYAWEKPFGKEVGRLRQKELEYLTKLAYTTAIGFSVILLATPIIQPIIVFLTYVNIQDKPLSASTAFTTVALFNIMRFPFAFLPMGLLQFIQSKISLNRLERYLALPELKSYVEEEPHPDAAPDSEMTKSGSITIKDGNFGWIDPDAPEIKPVQDEPPKKGKKKGEDDVKEVEDSLKSLHRSKSNSSLTSSESGSRANGGVTLQDLNCEIEAGSLVAVVGSVGSGKSSFLSAILGEMESISESKIYCPRNENEKGVDGYVSYCTQSPWVINETLKGNILFGREFDEGRYNLVLENCALMDDIAILPAGDMTEIGERGINLSGGQKARVALARAMYAKQAKLLLLDDPLSAVDSHVGQHLFSKAIAGEMSEGITRILVTHHVHVLNRCEKVIVLEHGRIKHQGSYQELIERGVDFAGAIDVSKTNKSEGKEGVSEVTETSSVEKSKLSTSKAEAVNLKKSGAQLIKEEEREEGDVAGQVYSRYAKSGGICLAVLVFVIQGIGRACEIGAAFWLAYWAEQMIGASIRGEPLSDSEVASYVGIYALFGFLGICGLGGRGMAIAKHRLRASKKLHDGLTDAILRAPVAFFDVTPIGRVLNRFAADMDNLDLKLTQTLSQGVSTVFSVLGAFGAIVAATKGTFIIALVPFGYTYHVIQRWFRKTSTELQRVTSVSNSPIFADFSQTLSGTSTIRAYGVQTDFFNKCKTSFDNMNASYILVQLAGYWLALRLDIIGGMISMFIGLVAISTLDSAFIPAGWLGLALSYSIEVTSFLKHGVMMLAQLEADMNSVERILFYTDNIEPESPDANPASDPEPGTWPSTGKIEFSNASMRYRDGPLVLKDLSLTVKGGEKIGVCGRTGSGKSSLMISLFRISEIEKDGGTIIIDGVNTGEVGTDALRSNLSIIPQDPVMFSNTVRYNLDPFVRYSDEELWDALSKVQLSEVIAELPKGLNEEIAEGGENFSQGQRQLLCIARSLLRKPKILVMDEATASIDNETDAAIQEMIRENFADATVLTIAHRLNTIMDSDRVLVLDKGRMAEFDTPENLLTKENGLFRAMVEKSRAAHDSSINED